MQLLAKTRKSGQSHFFDTLSLSGFPDRLFLLPVDMLHPAFLGLAFFIPGHQRPHSLIQGLTLIEQAVNRLADGKFQILPLRQGMNSLGGKDEKWRGILMDALFLGMISAFLGLLFANVRDGVPGFIPIVVALVSALLMGVCGILIRVLKWTWLEQYALPLCMLGAMALSIPITALMA